MPKARERAEEMVPTGGGAWSSIGRDSVVEALADDLRTAAAAAAAAISNDRIPIGALGFVLRYVNIQCPSGKHQRSMLTFHGYNTGVLFCQPCEQGWTEPTTHPALRDLATDSPR